MAGIPGVAVGGARLDEVAAAGTAAHHPARGIAIVVVSHPFPDVAGHVERTEGAGPLRVGADHHRLAGILARARALVLEVAPVGMAAVELVTPRKLATVAAARGLFPLVLGGQAAAGEGAEGPRLVPVDAGHGQLEVGAEVDGERGTAPRGHAAGVLSARDLGAVDVEGGQGAHADRPLVVRAFGRAARKGPCGHQHTMGLVSRSVGGEIDEAHGPEQGESGEAERALHRAPSASSSFSPRRSALMAASRRRAAAWLDLRSLCTSATGPRPRV